MNRSRILSLLVGLSIAPIVCADQYDPPAAYYQNATGTGATLKSQLYTIISAADIPRSYGQARYAMGTGQGTISGGLLDIDPNNSSNIILVYNDASILGQWDAGATWNREHV